MVLRRNFLAVGGAATVVGVGGCLDGFADSRGENGDSANTTEDELAECEETAQEVKEEWRSTDDDRLENPPPESIAGRRNCDDADRPEPTRAACDKFVAEGSDYENTYVSIGITSYPDPPSAFDDETIVAYVAEYERAYTQNDLVEREGTKIVGGGAGIDEEDIEIFDAYDEITVVRIAFGVSDTTFFDGGIGASSPLSKVAVYGVDETGLVRAAAGEHEVEDADDDGLPDSLDPLEDGDLLECF